MFSFLQQWTSLPRFSLKLHKRRLLVREGKFFFFVEARFG
jgi:hypothetical protein